VSLFSAAPVLAQYDDNRQAADEAEQSGIETKTVASGVSVMMPKGGRMHKRNDTTYVMESADEYAARKFVGVEDRIAKLEKADEELRSEIDAMKSRLAEMEKAAGRNADHADKK